MHSAYTVRSLRLRPLTAFVALALAAGATTGGAGASESDASPRATGAAPHGHAGLFASSVPLAPQGITRTVQNCNDSGSGSLREAYFLAGDQDTIDLSHLGCSRITLTTGALSPPVAAPANVTLLGPGRPFVVDGNGIDSVMIHRGTGTLLVNGLTITNGKHAGYYGGGCIYSSGSVALIGSTVSVCRLTSTGSSVARGGAIFAKSDLSLLFSSVIDSTAYSHGSHSAGGGIYARNVFLGRSAVSGNTASSYASYALGGGVFTTTRLYTESSTISGNSASEGAGAFSGSASIVNSTISGNDASAVGGVYARSYAQVYNSTIVKNTSFVGGYAAGLFVKAANSITLQSSIVALNNVDATVVDIASGAATTIVGANNLITGVAAQITLPGDTRIAADPQLGPLDNNGGPTQTHALRWNSPAIERGNNLRGLTFDQRGSDRVTGARADIGAFEFVDAIFGNGFDPVIE